MAEPRRAVVKTAKPPTTVVRVGKPEPRRAEPTKKASTSVAVRAAGRGPRRAVIGDAAKAVEKYAAKLGERLGTGSTTTLYTPWWLTEFDSQVGGVSPILQNGTAVANASVAAVQAAFATIYPGSSLPLVQQSSGPIPSPNMTSSQVLAYIAAQATADAAAYAPVVGSANYPAVLDTPAYGRTNSTVLMSKLNLGVENAVLTIVGDSTGDYEVAGVFIDWVHLHTAWLAAKFPAYTFIFYTWDIGTNAYDAPITIQTGTGTGNSGGPFVCTIYSGSAPGKAPAYSVINLTTMVPVAPDCLIINHGHNLSETPQLFMNSYMELVIAIRRMYEGTPLIFSSQNPRTAPNTTSDIVQKMIYMTRLQLLAAQEGATYVPIMETFLQDPRGVTNLVNPADGIHPNAAGFLLWAGEMERVFGGSAPSVLTGQRASAVATLQRDIPIFIPGNLIFPGTTVSGSPAAQQANGFVAIMRYAKTTGQIGGPTPLIYIPSHWQEIKVSLIWDVIDATAGNVCWRMNITTAPLGSVPSNYTLTEQVAAAAPGVAYQTVETVFYDLQVPPSNPLGFRVFRLPTDASDTYANYADLIGIRVRRAA